MSSPTTLSDVAIIIERENEQSSDVFIGSLDKIHKAAVKLGLRVFTAERDRINQRVVIDDFESLGDRPTFVYGSIQFVRDLKGPYYAYGYSGTDFLTFSSHVPRGLLVNEDFALVSWGDLKRSFWHWSERLDPVGLFVRPSSDKKVFAGTVMPRERFRDELKAVETLSAVTPETLCVIAPFRSIDKEFRFFVVNRQIVSSTYYDTYGQRWLPASTPATPRPSWKEIELAEKVTRLDWQPDSCYTVDIAVLDSGEARIVEFNSFCCSGVYNADAVAILQAVADQTIRDYSD